MLYKTRSKQCYWLTRANHQDYEIKSCDLSQAVILCKLLTSVCLKLPRRTVWQKHIFNEKQMLFQKYGFSRINKYFIFYYTKDSYISFKKLITLFWLSFRIWVWVGIPIRKPVIASHLSFIHSYRYHEHLHGSAKQTAFHGSHSFAVVFSFMYLVTNYHLHGVCE